MNIRFAGFGGQGIVMAGYVLGHAGILDGFNALQTQSYGSEARGGTCKSDVVISREEIVELAPGQLDVLVAMAQPALDRFLPRLKPGGILIYDSDLVTLEGAGIAPSGSSEPAARDEKGGAESDRGGVRCFGVPATAVAQSTFGRDVVANAVVLGVLAAVTDVVSGDALRRAMTESVPPKTVEMNLAAFEEGLRRGVDRETPPGVRSAIPPAPRFRGDASLDE